MSDPTVLRAAATQAVLREHGHFDLLDLPIDATLLVLPDREELLLGRGSQAIRMSVSGLSLLSGPVGLEFRITSLDPLAVRSAALHRFAAFRRSRAGSIAANRMGSAEKRLLLLRTLDALAVATSHRQVATIMFGAEMVESSWDAASDHLRSRVRRLIRQARIAATSDCAHLLLERPRP
jgi:hypothetical protein